MKTLLSYFVFISMLTTTAGVALLTTLLFVANTG